jgi:group I intron endonuclease
MGYIYRIRNLISGKWYIGCTKEDDVNTRWKGHKQTLNRNAGCPALKDAFKKYGVENFKFEVIIICFDDDMYEYEKQYIKKYNTQVPNGYNIGPGGIGGSFIGKKHTKETIDKIKKTLRDKYKDWTPEQKKAYGDKVSYNMMIKDLNISDRMKKSDKWQKAVEEKRIGANGHKNVKLNEDGNIFIPEETKKKISESLKKYYSKNDNITKNINIQKHRNSMAKVYGMKVGQFDKEGNLIKEHESASEAARVVGYKSSTSINNVIDTNKEAKGFLWKKLGEPVKKALDNVNKYNNKP